MNNHAGDESGVLVPNHGDDANFPCAGAPEAARSEGPDGGAAGVTRREILAWTAKAAVLATVSDALGFTASAGEQDAPVKIADLAAVPAGSVQAIKSPHLILSRTDKGICVMSSLCTHRQRRLNVNEQTGAIVCPAHGARFDKEGKPIAGPSQKPLTWYKTEVKQDGTIWADTSVVVKQGDWTPLPGWAKPNDAPAKPDAAQEKPEQENEK